MIRGWTGNSSSLWATLKPSAVANLSAALFGIAVWLALSLGSPCAHGAVAKQSGRDTDARQTKGTPSIAATPERVEVNGRTGSTEIVWNTGNGSIGFVFVTVNGRQPALVAKSPEGRRVISWIRTGRYVFELYGEAERRTLLATVTVSGVAETAGAPRTALWQGLFPWLLIPALIAVLYFALYLSTTGPPRTEFPTEPTTSPRPLHVTRNLLFGLAAFICVDGAVFHTRLYSSILAPDSYAGRIAAMTRAEKQRPSSGLKEVLVLGDSRMAEGFSTAVADELGSAVGLKFVNLAEPASTIVTWHYILREVDPTAQRYWAIIVPYGIGYEPKTAEGLRTSMAGPLLRYGDCFRFASAFQTWSGRFRAFTACILRGSAYQSDVVDFLQHPIARIRSVKLEPSRLRSRAVYEGRDYDIVGTSYDPKTRQVTFPPRLTEAQREVIRNSLVQPAQSETQHFLKMQRDGIRRIFDRYSDSSTAIVLTPVPRSPFGELPGFSITGHSAFPSALAKKAAFSLPEQTFDFLEKPEYYFDPYHLNAKGRQKFTRKLVSEVVGQLRSDGSHVHSKFQRELKNYVPSTSLETLKVPSLWASSTSR
jgi:hypothetical protein